MKTIRCRQSTFPSAALLLLLGLAIPCQAQRGPVPGIDTRTPYLIHYGNWDSTLIANARNNYKIVILHPSTSNITPTNIATIRSGPDGTAGNADDVKVLAYISAGEDDRPGAPFAGDGAGPRVDPRPSYSGPLTDDIAPLGDPSPGGTEYASYYLDDNDLNGDPDQNSVFGGYYVNPGDPAWYAILKDKTKATDGRSGIRELLGTTYGAGYGCDGLFLDTLDTPAPNSFGATYFEWTAKAYRDLVKNISDDNPTKLLLANRGVFFFNPNLKPYKYTLRPYINLVMFESYYTDSSGSGAASAFFDDNKFNYAPKINAEANRPDGFTVFGLGYTSAGESPALIEQDFIENQREQGWLLYRTNPALDAVPFTTQAATWNAANPDAAAPVWDSTAATGADSDPGTPGNQAPTPRVGLQEVVAGNGSVTLRWDIARDQTGPVRYDVYYTTDPVMNFNTATKLPNVTTAIPANYATGTGAGRYANEFVVTGLANNTPYRFAVRAADALGQEDANTVSLAATPSLASNFRSIAIDGNFSDWAGIPVIANDPVNGSDVDFADIQVANDSDYLYVRFTLHSAASPFSDFNTHLFLDADANQASGFQVSGAVIGSELMVEIGSGYDQRGGGFNEGGINSLGWSISPAGPASSFELRVSRAATFATGSAPVFAQDAIRLALQDNRGETTAAIPYTMASPPPPYSNYAGIVVDGNIADWSAISNALVDPASDGNPDIVAVKVANDADYLYLLVEYAAATDTNTLNGSPSLFLSLDNDANLSTGFNVYGLGQIGSEVSWQNDFVFAQSAGNYNLGATFTNAAPGIAPYFANTTHQEYRIPRNASYNLGGPQLPVFPQNLIRLALWSDGVSVEFAGGFEYTFAATPPPVVASHFTHIEADGDPSDWSNVPVVFTDPSTDGTPDVTTVKVANDDDYLYVLIQYATAVDTNTFNSSPSNFLSLDNDANPATGYNIFGLGQIGAEVSWQNDFPFAQSAGSFNLGAAFTNSVPGIAPFFSNTTFQEYRIPRNASYNLGGPQLPVFPQNLIRLALWSDDLTAAEFAGGFNYQFATNPGGTAYQKWRLNGFTAPELLLPLVSGDSADPDFDGISNFLEFALDLLPQTSDVGGLPDVTQTLIGPDRFLTFTYTRRPAADGVIYQPQTSSNLTGWNGAPAQFTTVSTTPLGGGFDEVAIRLNTPIPTGPKFIRLNVSLVP